MSTSIGALQRQARSRVDANVSNVTIAPHTDGPDVRISRVELDASRPTLTGAATLHTAAARTAPQHPHTWQVLDRTLGRQGAPSASTDPRHRPPGGPAVDRTGTRTGRSAVGTAPP